MHALITTLIEFLLVIAVGYITCRLGVLNSNAVDKVSELIVKVTAPTMILASACSFKGDINLMYTALLVGVAVYAVLPFLAKLFSVVFRVPVSERGIYEFMIMFGNVGFMGLPLANAVFGSDAVLYVSVLQILPFNLLIYTYGVYLFSRGETGKEKMNPKLLLQPGVLVIPIALLVLLFNIKLPLAVTSVISMVGDTTTPLSMMVIGASFVGISFKKILCKKHIYPMAVFRLILVPVIGCFVMRLCHVPELLCSLFAATAGLPVAATTVIYSHTYGKSVETASAGIFITTLLCALTVPLVMYILGITI